MIGRTSVAGASVAILLGAVALTGWAIEAPALTTLVPGHRATQPLTALSLILAGYAVVALKQSRGWHPGAFLAAALVMLISIQALIQHITGTSLGTDDLLFPREVTNQPYGYVHPGRPSAPTATGFILVAVAVCLARMNRRAAAVAYSSVATAVLALVAIALLSHLFGVAQLTGLLAFTQVGIPTAIGLGGLSVGLLALRTDVGWVSQLVGEAVGAAAARWWLPVVIVSPVAAAWLAFEGSQQGLYTPAFRLALTTVVTIGLLAGFTIRGAIQLNKLAAARSHLLQAQEDERRRIARDLHDSAVQDLVAIQLNLILLKREKHRPTANQMLADCSTAIVRLQDEIRTLAFIHHPPSLTAEGIGTAIEKLAAGFGTRTGIKVETFIDEIRRASPGIEATLYRIAQEALANVHRHAGATRVTLRLEELDRFIHLTIEDDGIGFDGDVQSQSASLGVGIMGMTERVTELGGRFSIRKLGKGTSVTASLPYGA